MGTHGDAHIAEKNEASSDAWIEFDKVELSDSQNGAPVIIRSSGTTKTRI
ncbi:MAG: hypothetical protein ACLRI7_10275 [Ruthenibacterium lactatiformans]